MKHMAKLLVPIAVLVALSFGAVAFGDRSLFVPPPDAVSEGFVRELVTKRWSRAKPYLQDPEAVTQEELEALAEKLGDPSEVEAETITRDDETALVNVRVSSSQMSEVIAFRLVFDREWKIDL
jgi:hypothetical protein